MGNTVGSRLIKHQIDPVTTDSAFKADEIAIPASDTSMLSNAGFSWPNGQLGAYISGYVDGEGCFSISISRRPKLLVGWEVRPSFSVGQKRGRTQVLEMMLQYFHCGTIRYSAPDDMDHYETRSIHDIWAHIIPHFEKYPLLSSKQKDFELFRSVCQIVRAGKHLRVQGLHKTLLLVMSMPNISSERRDYLRDITTSLVQKNKSIVYATSIRGGKEHEVLSRTNGVTTGGLSQRGTR